MAQLDKSQGDVVKRFSTLGFVLKIQFHLKEVALFL